MVLSARFAAHHIAFWEAKLSSPFRGHRGKWPSRLFHHAPIENAVEILKSGALLSRDASHGCRVRDIADQEILAARSRAHGFVRFYFRPRTPTQFHIEGIRKPGEFYRDEPRTHAPILVMFVFDAKSILIRYGTRYSNLNMQSPLALDGDTEEFFTTIDFDKVYHEGPTAQDRSITLCRCAEVLAISPLALGEMLQWIYCRSQAERVMLLHLLGSAAEKWRPRLRVSDDINVFEKKFTFVDQVELQKDGLSFKLHPRSDGQKVVIAIRMTDQSGRRVVSYGPALLAPVSQKGARWLIKCPIQTGIYSVSIDLEGCRAFEADLLYDDLPF